MMKPQKDYVRSAGMKAYFEEILNQIEIDVKIKVFIESLISQKLWENKVCDKTNMKISSDCAFEIMEYLRQLKESQCT